VSFGYDSVRCDWQDPAEWRALLGWGGFAVEEEGTQPATRYFFARKLD
jgi:hypothetical protein